MWAGWCDVAQAKVLAPEALRAGVQARLNPVMIGGLGVWRVRVWSSCLIGNMMMMMRVWSSLLVCHHHHHVTNQAIASMPSTPCWCVVGWGGFRAARRHCVVRYEYCNCCIVFAICVSCNPLHGIALCYWKPSVLLFLWRTLCWGMVGQHVSG
jgi:hypothetical protein